MSIRTVRFKKKVAQARRAGQTNFEGLLPKSRSISNGRTTIFGQVDSMDEDGNPQKAGKRYPGRATGKIGTEPMNGEKEQVYRKLMK